MAKYRLRRGEWFILIALALLQAAWITDPSPDTAYAPRTVPTVSAGLFTPPSQRKTMRRSILAQQSSAHASST